MTSPGARPYAKRVVLLAPPWGSPLLRDFVEACVRDGVGLVCVYGEDCERVHDVIDELIVVVELAGVGVGPITSWHEAETCASVWDFALQNKVGEWAVDDIQAVRLPA